MKPQLTEIPAHQLHRVSGGHVPIVEGLSLLFILEIPHIIMGMRELVNYIGERWNNGADNIDDEDYFTQGLYAPYHYIKGLF
jgi:hypothetical protein